MFHFSAIRSSSFESEEHWLKKLEILKGFYNTESIDYDEALEFQSFAEKMSIDISNATGILERLAPSCKNIIKSCFWNENILNCEEHFMLKVYPDGFCCAFNLNRGKSENIETFSNADSSKSGLAVLLNASDKDHFYTEGNSNGFAIKIFGSLRNPDITTGEMKEFTATAGEDIDVNLNIVSQITTEEAKAHGVEKRGCNFPNENENTGLADCLHNCKLQSIESLCNCYPFYVQRTNKIGATPQCSFVHMECMERYRGECLKMI